MHRFEHDLRAAFHAAAIAQCLRTANLLACGGARQAAPPAVLRAPGRRALCGVGQCRVDRLANPLSVDIAAVAQPNGCEHERERVFFATQMPHLDDAQYARQRWQRRRGRCRSMDLAAWRSDA